MEESDEKAVSVEEESGDISTIDSALVTAPSVVIESQMGGSITVDEILSRLPENVETVYVKPEKNRACWVNGNESGLVELCRDYFTKSSQKLSALTLDEC